mmetsp:Transcript_19218/g.22902  ORF Transcript_19218/g.22902 Transcript_19218/m.22902 type:complete len:124 (+) Transcript_19218:47-418(+)
MRWTHLSTLALFLTQKIYLSPQRLTKRVEKKERHRLGLCHKKKLNACPANAPSDEISYFCHQSPMKRHVPPNKEKYSQLLTPSTLSAIKTMPTVATSNQASRYDDDLLQKCVLDLTKSFDMDN